MCGDCSDSKVRGRKKWPKEYRHRCNDTREWIKKRLIRRSDHGVNACNDIVDKVADLKMLEWLEEFEDGEDVREQLVGSTKCEDHAAARRDR